MRWFRNNIDPSLLDKGSKRSSMRFILIQVLRIVKWLIYSSIVLNLLSVLTLKGIDWKNYAIFIGAVTTLLGAAVTGKWLQAIQETKKQISEIENEEDCDEN
jgi:hypothetical protein